jgi:hypothetical protein
VRAIAACTNRNWRGFGQIAKTAKPKSRYLPKSTVGDFATTSTGSAQSLIKSLLKRRVIMKIFAGLIRRELRLQADKYGQCAIYEDELQRVWPIDEENRKAKIEQFANENGFRLIYYKPGLCAIFEEQ